MRSNMKITNLRTEKVVKYSTINSSIERHVLNLLYEVNESVEFDVINYDDKPTYMVGIGYTEQSGEDFSMVCTIHNASKDFEDKMNDIFR